MSQILLNTTEIGCLDIIKKWSDSTQSGHDGLWYGFSELYDEMIEAGFDVESGGEKYIKDIVKRLYRNDYIVLEPTYNNDYMLSGSGYFFRGGKHD